VLERLLSKRRVREVLGLFLMMIWVLPRFLYEVGVRVKLPKGLREGFQAIGFPWSAAAQGAIGNSLALSVLVLLVWILIAFWFGRTQFESSLRFDPLAAQATPVGAPRGGLWLERFYRFPEILFPDPLAAIIEKELRSLARSPRFRMSFIMGFTFGLVVWLPMVITRRGTNSVSSRYFLVIVGVYALTLIGQVSYWNAFGFDRSATAFYFAAPQPFRRVLIGKNLAALCFIYLELFVLAGVTALLRLSGWQSFVEAVVVVGVCAVYMLALGNYSSVHHPRGMSAEGASRGSGAGKFQGLLFILYPLALTPIGLAYLARYALDSEVAFFLILGFAAAIGAYLYGTAMESAVHTATSRRERFLHELSEGDGPVLAG
jgi:ABC-2 type transport system permease protein